jgi:hypothetical protein
MSSKVILGDCLEIMTSLPDKAVDLTFCSPPYESQRTYGIDFNLTGQAWVDWAVERFLQCLRVTNGLVCWVVAGSTQKYRWSATPALLMADLHRRGVKFRTPPIYHRSGIPGSGGPDWLRNDYEFIVCASDGKLPWSDNTAMGKPPVYGPGGPMSYRQKNGCRIGGRLSKSTDVELVRANGKVYSGVKITNPGNVVRCKVGGGHLGSRLAHENEAPFPEKLAEFFIRSFCRPGGTVMDCFCGSGTTLSVAKQTGREWLGIDIRQSQVNNSTQRLVQAQGVLIA